MVLIEKVTIKHMTLSFYFGVQSGDVLIK